MTSPIVFVSHVDLSNRKGGFDGLGGKIYDILQEKLGDIVLIDSTHFTTLFGGTDSLRNLWHNLATMK